LWNKFEAHYKGWKYIKWLGQSNVHKVQTYSGCLQSQSLGLEEKVDLLSSPFFTHEAENILICQTEWCWMK